MRRFSFRCWLGFHKWERLPAGEYINPNGDGWFCYRCITKAPGCAHCGEVHDPTKIVLCIYTVERNPRNEF